MQKTVVSITPMSLEADSRTLKIARSLARLGYRSIVVEGAKSRDLGQFDLPVVSLANGAALPPTTALAVRRRLRDGTGFAVADAAVAAAYRARYYWEYGVKVARRLPPADLYYLHAFTYGPAVAQACRKRRADFIYDAHDIYSRIRVSSEFSDFERDWINPFLERLEQRCCDEAAAVVTVSEGVADLIAGRFGRKPTVIRNAHDTRSDRPPPRDIRAVTGVAPDDTLVVVVGNDKPGQATAAALDALPRLPDKLHLAFVGSGYEANRAKAAEMGLAGRAHFVGHVPADAIVPFTAAADAAAILLFPYTENYLHSLPNKFFQAIGAGLPVLYPAALVELARMCRGYRIGIPFDPRDAASLEAGFMQLVTDPAVLASEREASRRVALELSWAREEDRLAELLASIHREPLALAV